MCIDESSKVAFCVFPGNRQLFYYVRGATGGLAAEECGVRCNVGDVNAVRASIAALENASADAFVVVEVIGDVGEAATVGVYVLILCHGGATSKLMSIASGTSSAEMLRHEKEVGSKHNKEQ